MSEILDFILQQIRASSAGDNSRHLLNSHMYTASFSKNGNTPCRYCWV